MSRCTFFVWAVAIALIAVPTRTGAQTMGAMSDSDYIAKVMTAAPASVVKGATIVQVTHSEINAAYGHRIIRLKDGWLVKD